MRHSIALWILYFCIAWFAIVLAIGQSQSQLIGEGVWKAVPSAGGCSQATSYLARTSGSPNTSAVTALICGMVTGGYYSLGDGGYIIAINSASNAALNIFASNSFTPNGSPTFTANSGYAGGAFQYLATGINSSTGTNCPGGTCSYTQNSASMFMWTPSTWSSGVDSGALAGYLLSGGSSGNTYVYPHYTDNDFYYSANTGSGANFAWVTGTRFFGFVRPSGSTQIGYLNATGTSNINGSSTLVNDSWQLMNRENNASPLNGTISFAWIGGALTGTQQGNLCHLVNVYMTAVAGASAGTC